MIARLCFTEVNRSCDEYPECENMYDCDMNPYAAGHERYNRIMSQSYSEKNCTLRFEKCITPFRNCIEECKSSLTKVISSLDDRMLYRIINNSTAHPDHQLLPEFNTTLQDIKTIQMHHLVIGNHELFISTYAICLLYTSPSPRDLSTSRMPSSA